MAVDSFQSTNFQTQIDDAGFSPSELPEVRSRAQGMLTGCETDYTTLCDWWGVKAGDGFGSGNRVIVTTGQEHSRRIKHWLFKEQFKDHGEPQPRWIGMLGTKPVMTRLSGLTTLFIRPFVGVGFPQAVERCISRLRLKDAKDDTVHFGLSCALHTKRAVFMFWIMPK